MSFIKQQYDYSQTFNCKQITEKTAKVPSFYDICKLICLCYI